MTLEKILDVFHITLENGEKIEIFSESGEHYLVTFLDNKLNIEKVVKK